jgi:hypothetical protein
VSPIRHHRARSILSSVALAAALVVLSAGPAFATDYGNWEWLYCGDRGEICNWRGDAGASKLASSSTRDSRYGDDYYQGGYTMSDMVKAYQNTFGTLRLRSYHDANYVNGSTCLAPGYIVGPYPLGTASGLSSFKSC